MNKKLGIFLLLLCSTLLLAGCGMKKYKSFTKWAEKNMLKGHIEEFNCPELTSKSFIGDDYFINDNTIYSFDFTKRYKKTKNCESITKIDGIVPIYLSYNDLIDENGIEYEIHKKSVEKKEYTYKDYHYADFIKKYKVNTKVNGGIRLSEYFDIIFIDLDNKVYGAKFKTKGSDVIDWKLTNFKGDISKDEKVIANYGKLIKTDKAFYRLNHELTNKEKCKKYEDVRCKYKNYIIKDDILTAYYDDIIYIDKNEFGGFIITKDNKKISLQNYYLANPLKSKDA